MRASVLDLGSNSFHVLVADLDAGGVFPVLRHREMLHLGALVARHGFVPDTDRERAVATVAHLSELARRAGATAQYAVATSALRDAENGPEVIAQLAEAAGTGIRVLDGAVEGRYGYIGVRAAVAVPSEPVLVLDLGGGSLELTVGAGATVHWSTSLPIGVGRASAPLSEDPPRRSEIATLEEEVDRHLAPVVNAVAEWAPATTIAVGGTVRAMARIVARDRGTWLPATLNQLRLSTAELHQLRDRLVDLDLDGRAAVPGMKQRRAGHLHVAAVLLTRALDRLGLPTVQVSDWGLREGVLLDTAGHASIPDPVQLRRRELDRVRSTFVPDDPHPQHVARLAAQLFDGMRELHRLTEPDRELLLSAATLHSVGEAVALRRQHVHGAYLVEHAELRGFDPEETAVLTTLVRYHPSRGLDPSFAPFASLDADLQTRVRRLLALLQLADGLDRARDQAVREVAARVAGSEVVLELKGAGLHITADEFERRSAMFRDVFGVRVRVVDEGALPPPDGLPDTLPADARTR